MNKRITIPIAVYLFFQLPLYLLVKNPEYDEAIYLNVARNISQTGVANRNLGSGILYAEHTSLYQHFIGLLHFFTGDQVFLFRFVTSLFGIAIIWLVWLIVEEAAGWEAALVSSTLAAFNPFFHHYAFYIREEIWMCLFIILAIRNIQMADKQPDDKSKIFFVSLWLTLAFLTKELSLIFSAFAILYLFLTGRNFGERVFRAFLPTAGIVVGAGLWLSWVYLIDPQRFAGVASRWSVSISGGGGAGAKFSWATIGPWLQTIVETIGTPIFIAIFLLGCIFLAKRFGRGKITTAFVWFVTIFPIFAVIVSLLISLKRDRHFMPIIFLIAISIGLTIDWASFFTWSRKSILNGSIALILVGISLFEISPLKLPDQVSQFDTYWENIYFQRLIINDRHYSVFEETGRVLQTSAPRDEVIYVVNAGPVAGYYADRNYQFLYNGTYDQVVTYLDHANWLIYDADHYVTMSPEEKFLVLELIDCAFEEDQSIATNYREVQILTKDQNHDFQSCLPG